MVYQKLNWLGQQLTLVGKWPMANHYIVLCRETYYEVECSVRVTALLEYLDHALVTPDLFIY